MESQNYHFQDPNVIQIEEGSVSRKFFAQVFLWMFVALSLSAFAAYLFGANETFRQLLYNTDPASGARHMSIMGYVVMFAPLALVFTMGFGMSRLSYPALLGIFILYSVLTGMSLSFIILSYTSSSITICFVSAAAIFGIMAFMGYTTNVDLTRFGSLLFIGLIGLVIASLINMFVGSSRFDYILSFFGVAIFTGLTAYDVQKIKRIGQGIESNGEMELRVDAKKTAIMAALSLYLDFLNIFLYLLRIFGDRK